MLSEHVDPEALGREILTGDWATGLDGLLEARRTQFRRLSEEAAKRRTTRLGLAPVRDRRQTLAMTSNALRQELFKLSTAEKLELVEELWDSIAADAERDDRVLPLSDEQKVELERRIAAHRADPSRVIPWEQVREELLRDRS